MFHQYTLYSNWCWVISRLQHTSLYHTHRVALTHISHLSSPPWPHVHLLFLSLAPSPDPISTFLSLPPQLTPYPPSYPCLTTGPHIHLPILALPPDPIYTTFLSLPPYLTPYPSSYPCLTTWPHIHLSILTSPTYPLSTFLSLPHHLTPYLLCYHCVTTWPHIHLPIIALPSDPISTLQSLPYHLTPYPLPYHCLTNWSHIYFATLTFLPDPISTLQSLPYYLTPYPLSYLASPPDPIPPSCPYLPVWPFASPTLHHLTPSHLPILTSLSDHLLPLSYITWPHPTFLSLPPILPNPSSPHSTLSPYSPDSFPPHLTWPFASLPYLTLCVLTSSESIRPCSIHQWVTPRNDGCRGAYSAHPCTYVLPSWMVDVMGPVLSSHVEAWLMSWGLSYTHVEEWWIPWGRSYPLM